MLTNDTIATHRTFRSDAGSHLLVIDSSQIYDLPEEVARALDKGEELPADLLPLSDDRSTGPHAFAKVPPQSISLNISSSCNLGCRYCYAARGSFEGAQSRPMDWETARAAIDRLFSVCDRNAPATVGFLGGEPFVNARLIRRAVRYATSRGPALGLDVRFSVTTNGTLLTTEDIQMLRAVPFTVTVSVDGGREVYQQQRVGADFDQFRRCIEPLLHDPGTAKVSARATVTRSALELVKRYDDIRGIGFREVGFSPLRVSPDGNALDAEDWRRCLAEYRELGEREVAELRAGRGSGFSNLVIALKQIHRGACSPYPCGAGGGYFSVSADGTWYACHRAVGDRTYALGDSTALDEVKRTTFLADRHVDRLTDCRRCWARYLCSGSCHQEAKARSAESCNFIRGWLDFCLSTYCSLTKEKTWDSIVRGCDERQVQTASAERAGA